MKPYCLLRVGCEEHFTGVKECSIDLVTVCQVRTIRSKSRQSNFGVLIFPPTQGSSLHVPECALCRSIQGFKARRSSCSCRISLLKVSSFLSSRSCGDELSFPLSTHILHHIETNLIFGPIL